MDKIGTTAIPVAAPGELPFPKLEEEAIALLAASNSVMNALALQGLQISPGLLAALTAFTRANLGYKVTFSDVAKNAFLPMEGMGPEVFVDRLLCALDAVANDMRGKAQEKDFSGLLRSCGDVQLIMQRLGDIFGWTRSHMCLSARLELDKTQRE